MVPHIKVEDQLQEIAAIAEQVFAVTSVPDEKKGEKLIVLHTLSAEKLQECVTGLSQSNLPALWRPRADQFLHVESCLTWAQGNSICAASGSWLARNKRGVGMSRGRSCSSG